ncbi:hypothetical protein MGN70_005401 [Eutypa lata]|uniref:Uncharacterized protein n=1 Tax=Eutypa lata (strain UCR-EL1) TaxID=1287681 RepID=M7SBP6_EUTLA|nr:hypothetical protein UCREL1_11517 [Eutypa lata UCREL1]KAI1253193.1 hypothetical protein MGN70_005401 [Eutypa lata]
MGNICGKADSEAFSQPGRVLGSAPPPQPQRASVPAGARGPTPPKVVGGPPRTLGGRAGAGGGEAADEARRRAAEAAEARAQAKPAGKLGSQLAAQKKQTRNDTLKEISSNERRQRDADEAAQARTHG